MLALISLIRKKKNTLDVRSRSPEKIQERGVVSARKTTCWGYVLDVIYCFLRQKITHLPKDKNNFQRIFHWTKPQIQDTERAKAIFLVVHVVATVPEVHIRSLVFGIQPQLKQKKHMGFTVKKHGLCRFTIKPWVEPSDKNSWVSNLSNKTSRIQLQGRWCSTD